MLVSSGCILASCAPSTPQARIQENPARFAALPANQQALVEGGEISRGMSRDAVDLAWGPPSSRFEGSKGGKATERWDYTGVRPVRTHFSGGFGYGRYGRYGGRYHPYSSYVFDVGPEIAYLPYRRATVWFLDRRVDSWETMR